MILFAGSFYEAAFSSKSISFWFACWKKHVLFRVKVISTGSSTRKLSRYRHLPTVHLHLGEYLWWSPITPLNIHLQKRHEWDMFYVWFQNTSYVSQNWFPTPFAWNHPRQRWLHRTSMLSSVVRINCSRKVIVRPGQSPSSWTACTSAPGRKTCSIVNSVESIYLQMAQVESETKQSRISPQPRKSSCKWKRDDCLCPILIDLFKCRFCLDTPNRNPAWREHFGGFESISLQPNLLQKDVDMYTVFCMNLLLYNDANRMLPKTMDQSQQAELADKSSSSDKACISLPMTWNDGRWVEL